jgi:DNA-binding CsgD family transcriptional regulator
VSLRRLWSPKLLERDDELDELDSAVAEAGRGAGSAVLIEAAAGLGKTRLLDHVRRRASRAGMRVLSARATELESDFPYGVARQLLEPAVADRSDAGGAELLSGAAAAAAPALGLAAAGSDGGVPVADADPADLPFSTLYGLYWLTVSLGDAEPLLLAVDDAHWADPPSLRFLAFLAARLEGLPILLAVAARPKPTSDDPLAQFAVDRSTRRIDPAPLGPGSTAALIEAALGSPPDGAFASACHELTGGNPFLLAELVRTLAAEGAEPTAATAKDVRQLAPDAVVRSVLLRLAPLPAAARALARAVAVLGDGCEPRFAAELAGIDPPTAVEAADALRGADVLHPEPPLRFLHPLVRNAVYTEIPAGARGREHGRAAELLAAAGMPAERIALHLLATDPAGDASVVRTLHEAARAALDQGAADPAIAYLRRALEEPSSPALRPDVLRLLLDAAVRSADVLALAPLADTLLGADAVEEVAADSEMLLRSGADLAMLLIGTGRVERGATLLERAIEVAERAGDLTRAVALEAQLASFMQLPPLEARERFARYDGRIEEGTPEHRLTLALHAWWTSALGGSAAEVGGQARRALAGGRIFAEQRGVLSPPPQQAVLVLARADELDAAAEAAEHLIATARASGDVVALASGWFMRAYAAHRRGDLRSAEADVRQAVDAAHARGFRHMVTIFSALLIELLIERAELEEAERELHACGMAGEIPDGYWLGPVHFGRGRLRLAQGRARAAADDLLELHDRMARWGMRSNVGYPADAYAARALLSLGERERARAVAQQELDKARPWGAPSAVAEALAACGAVTGGEGGVELLREAAELAASSPARLVHASALVDLGTALSRERRPSEAREPLRTGLELARRCGAVALARRAAVELEVAGERAPRHTPIGADALTPSERRVAEMAATGMTNREIAAALYVTVKTVESHLRATYDKLGIRSRKELAQALRPPSGRPVT